MAKFQISSVAVLTAVALSTVPTAAQGFYQPKTFTIDPIGAATNVAHKSTHRPTIRVTGTITNEGAECPALRADTGKLYTLAGGTGGFQPGDRVQVIGKVAQVSFCMQGTTIEVRRVIALR
jgi:hypothetical protein